MCVEDPATLVKTKIDGRICKIVALPRNLAFATVGRVDLTEKLFRGVTRMCGANDLRFEQLADVLPPILRKTWSARAPLKLSAEVDKQDSLLLGADCRGKIRCLVFRSEDNFEPIETTASPGNRVTVLGGFDLVDEKRLQDFTMDTGVRGEKMRAPWIAAKIRDLINEISALHPESIGEASYFSAIDCRGPVVYKLGPEMNPFVAFPMTAAQLKEKLIEDRRFGMVKNKHPRPGRTRPRVKKRRTHHAYRGPNFRTKRKRAGDPQIFSSLRRKTKNKS
jgi:hypothetical protein